MKEVKVTENIPDDVVSTIFEFCKAFNEVQEKENTTLCLAQTCDFSFDFQGRKFFCKKTHGSKSQASQECVIDVSPESELNKDIKDKNKDNKVNGEIDNESENVSNISDDNDIINDIKTPININDAQEQQNNTALTSKQGNSIGSNDYLFVRYNSIFLAKENNDQKFDVYCLFLGKLCDTKIKENDYVTRNTVKIESNIEKKKIQTFFKNVERGESFTFIVSVMANPMFNSTERTIVLKKIFNANTYSKEEINKINAEANSNLCKFNCCGLCG